MSGQKPPRPRPRPRPKGFDDVPELSNEEVERRVDVRGGAAPRGPVERAPRVPRGPRRRERTVARDSLLLIGLVIVGLVAVRVFLPDGPLSPSSTNAPSGTQAVAASIPATSNGQTPGAATIVPVITLPPGTVLPTALVEPTAEPTEPPPTPTLAPGQTPKPTPKVTPRPTTVPTTPTPPTPGPTQPQTAIVIVKMHVVNDNGGVAAAPAWTMKITGEVGSAVSPNNFPGSETGTPVTIKSGKGYSVSDNLAVPGYSDWASGGCQRDPGVGLPAGTTVTCTITRDDLPAHLNVTVNFSPTQPADNPNLSIIGTAGPSPASITSFGLTAVTLDANANFEIVESSPIAGYAIDAGSGTCSSAGLALNQTVSCTYTYTEIPPSPASPLPFLLLPLVRPRRWRTTTTG